MVNDGDVLSFGELRKALTAMFPDLTKQDRNIVMMIVWAHVFSDRAKDMQCCGKPIGCTNISEQCVMKDHWWKKLYARHPKLLRPIENINLPASDQTPDQEPAERGPTRSGQDESKSHT